MNKKITSLILALLMVSPLFTSCGDNKPETTQESNTESTTALDNKYSYIDEYVKSLAAEAGGYNGETFNIITRDTDAPTEDELTGEIQSDALYSRNMEIEEKFNVDINCIVATGVGYVDGAPSLEIADKVKIDTMSRTGEYDMIICNLMLGGTTMLIDGVIRTVDDMPTLDFPKSWWLNDMENQLSIGGRLYYLTGKIVASNYSDPAAIIFNKSLAEKYGLEDFYSMVKSGEWTIDNMTKAVSVIPTDNEVYRYYAIGGIDMYMGGGYDISEKDADGNLTLPSTLDSESLDYIEKISEFLGDKTQNINHANIIDPGDTYKDQDAWEDGKFLFWMDSMGRAADILDREVEFGILPIPKKDEAQSDYISYCQAGRTCGVFVSKAVKDIEKTAYITEAMAALSEKYLEPAYYQKVLKGRSAEGSIEREMLDIIYTTKKYELADIYAWGGIADLIDDASGEDSDGFSSAYKASIRSANVELKDMIEAINSEN